MIWFASLMLAGTSLADCFQTVAAAAPRQTHSVMAGLQWLRRQQSGKTHLFVSYDMPGETAAWTYDQALAIKSLLVCGESADAIAAVNCAARMLTIRHPKHCVWSDAYAATGLKERVQVEIDWERGYARWRWRQGGDVRARPIAVGPNAWMGLALLDLYARSKHEEYLAAGGRPSPSEYLAAAERIANFILSLQLRKGHHLPDGRELRDLATEGAIVGGYDEEGNLFPWVSVEHCVDSIAFLSALSTATGRREYLDAATLTARWLHREMWDASTACYFPGYADAVKGIPSTYGERLDPQTWSVLALDAAARQPEWPKQQGLEARDGLRWLDQFLCEVQHCGTKVVGFSKITGDPPGNPKGPIHPEPPPPWQGVWTEGTAGFLLAARRAGYDHKRLPDMIRSLQALQRNNRAPRRQQGGVLYSVGVSYPDVMGEFSTHDIPIATFEAHPNCLFGNVGLYGKGEPKWEAIAAARAASLDEPRVPPYSWYYEPSVPGYCISEDEPRDKKNWNRHRKPSRRNVNSGVASFRLVNGGRMAAERTEEDGAPVIWSSLGLDLGPRVDVGEAASHGPGFSTRPLDVSTCSALQFWARTENAKGAVLAVGFRDAHASGAIPQITVLPMALTPPPGRRITRSMRRFVVPLKSIRSHVDLKQLVHVNLEFGDRLSVTGVADHDPRRDGNAEGTIIYVDDIGFIHNLESYSGKGRMPEVYPQHWPFGSIAGTAWLIFVELDTNPFCCQVPIPQGRP